LNEPADEQIDFVAAITHELKTSLTAIIASAELMADDLNPAEGSPRWQLIQSIIRNAHRLNEKVTDFAEVPRPQISDFQFNPEPLAIDQVIGDVASRIHPALQSRRQSLTLAAPDSLPPVHADRRHLEQLLLTLISNASKFSPFDGEITVTAWQHDEDQLVTRVSDCCGGIPEEETERVFQPHYQIQRTDSKGGLGLAIARFLVELHGGRIWLVGRTGTGCSFFFSLPLAGGQA
jgi:signal transduction histidine kinase